MKAKKKDLQKKTLSDYGIQHSTVRIVNQEIQQRARLQHMIDGKDAAAAAEQLIGLLHEEAKVI